MSDLDAYPFEIRRLGDEEGGGFLITYPDFNRCIADGDTLEEAIANGREALSAVIATLKEMGHEPPSPGSGDKAGERFVQHLPQGLHARLAAHAEAEGISLDTLVVTMLADQLDRREAA